MRQTIFGKKNHVPLPLVPGLPARMHCDPAAILETVKQKLSTTHKLEQSFSYHR